MYCHALNLHLLCKTVLAYQWSMHKTKQQCIVLCFTWQAAKLRVSRYCYVILKLIYFVRNINFKFKLHITFRGRSYLIDNKNLWLPILTSICRFHFTKLPCLHFFQCTSTISRNDEQNKILKPSSSLLFLRSYLRLPWCGNDLAAD